MKRESFEKRVTIMKESILQSIVNCMAVSHTHREIQLIQTNHRLKLAGAWGIKKGDRLLEVGCGQGDTTAVLAHLVGGEGLVHGVDIASPDYGSPITVGDSMAHLKNSPLGKQIRVSFEMDILSEEVYFDENEFDAVVLSHCLWYFQSPDQLLRVLQKVRTWGKKLYIAEWDIRTTSTEQLAHFLAVHIQAQYEAFKENSFSNVRTLFTRADIEETMKKAGWTVHGSETISSPDLQDGEWEVHYVLSEYDSELNALSHLPAKFMELLRSQVYVLREVVNMHGVKPLNTFTVVGEKQAEWK
ncbi:class I SAM-dependent methyltransferase [Priestia koreensis]|uniref:class I SAM-dependent methyltransferase n=1 Tax=Priestia koreensis TaxID=284581 RepID=UPI0028F73660|nr:class I SAM-dependent methyltransferase [Priestia koreensis]